MQYPCLMIPSKLQAQEILVYVRLCCMPMDRKTGFPLEKISCATHTMRILVIWIAGIPVMNDINNHFPLMNNTGASFGMLSSIKSIYENINWSILPVEAVVF